MKIGIDIDDVITYSSELITEYAKKYFGYEDINLINNILHAKTTDAKLQDFYNLNLIEMQQNYKLKENVKQVIDRLRSNGHKIILITARGYTQIYKSFKKLSQIIVTKEYLKRHQIKFDKIIFKARDKKEECIKSKLDIMIDDSVFVLNNLKGTNIKCLLFNSISNQNFKTDFDTVSSWLELEKYINNL